LLRDFADGYAVRDRRIIGLVGSAIHGMRVFLSRTLLPLVAPVVILGAACLGVVFMPELSEPVRELLGFAPYIVLVAGALVSLRFASGRVFCIQAVLVLAYWQYQVLLADPASGARGPIAFAVFCVFVPLNLVVFGLLPERAVLSATGLRRLGVVAAQAVVVAVLLHAPLRAFADRVAVVFAEPGRSGALTMPPVALVLVGIDVLLLLLWIAAERAPAGGGIIGAIMSCAVCCLWVQDDVLVPVFMVAGGVALAAGTIQRSFDLAYRDELTGLPSRRALNIQLASPGRQFVLALLDIDHFKRVNDTYGHDVGDHVLRFVASRLQTSGGGGKAYRYGGEEFVLFFRRQELRGVLPHLEDVREMVGGYELRVRGQDRPSKRGKGQQRRGKARGGEYVSVTVSIGVAGRVDGALTADDVLAEADKALYRAKKTGRDKVCFGRRRKR